MSSYPLTEQEYNALPFGLDIIFQQQPTKILFTLKLSSIFKVLIAM